MIRLTYATALAPVRYHARHTMPVSHHVDRFERSPASTAPRFGHGAPPSTPQLRQLELSSRVLDDDLPKNRTVSDWQAQFQGIDLSQPIDVPLGDRPAALDTLGTLGGVNNVHAPSLLSGLWIQAASDRNEALDEALEVYTQNALAQGRMDVIEAVGRIGFNPGSAPKTQRFHNLLMDLSQHENIHVRIALYTGIGRNPTLDTDDDLRTLTQETADAHESMLQGALATGLASNPALNDSVVAKVSLMQIATINHSMIESALFNSLGANPRLEQTPWAQAWINRTLGDETQTAGVLASFEGLGQDNVGSVLHGLGSNPSIEHSPYIRQLITRLLQHPGARFRSSLRIGLASNPRLEHSPFAQQTLNQLLNDNITENHRATIARQLAAQPALQTSPYLRQMVTTLAGDDSVRVQAGVLHGLGINPRLQQSPWAQALVDRMMEDPIDHMRQELVRGLGQNINLPDSPYASAMIGRMLARPFMGLNSILSAALHYHPRKDFSPVIQQLIRENSQL